MTDWPKQAGKDGAALPGFFFREKRANCQFALPFYEEITARACSHRVGPRAPKWLACALHIPGL